MKHPSQNVFCCEPDILHIQPKTQEILKLSALPDKKATFDNRLMLSIKDNPKVETVNLSCTGCHVNFIITPKSINFDHAVLHNTSRQEILLENDSNINVFWKLVESEEILKLLQFSSVEGNMAPSAKEIVFVEYTPTHQSEAARTQVVMHVIFLLRCCFFCITFFC